MKVEQGERLQLNHRCLDCNPPTPAICYDIAYDGARPAYNFIFPNGHYDGFTSIEINTFFDRDSSRVFNKIAKYDFQNLRQLKRDFNYGFFDVAFIEQPISCSQYNFYTKQNYDVWCEYYSVLDVYNLKNQYLGRVGQVTTEHMGWEIIEPDLPTTNSLQGDGYRGTFLNCTKLIGKIDS